MNIDAPTVAHLLIGPAKTAAEYLWCHTARTLVTCRAPVTTASAQGRRFTVSVCFTRSYLQMSDRLPERPQTSAPHKSDKM
ncbi:Hypothetical protein SMAX5B_008931 [Scophthalmus maximus]|uniref:Uncharacterized protein n=1 Tax=Scophthalmus maximus TaxID=52904 RepID=A0A2U9CKB0_SCOMX|nr:Hypothetical protein SMAX5B_008931 [Scophthalmus maximus]KAF0043961.1 hypothetical protein F2P81_003119 [Scophthalmus maximus]